MMHRASSRLCVSPFTASLAVLACGVAALVVPACGATDENKALVTPTAGAGRRSRAYRWHRSRREARVKPEGGDRATISDTGVSGGGAEAVSSGVSGQRQRQRAARRCEPRPAPEPMAKVVSEACASLVAASRRS